MLRGINHILLVFALTFGVSEYIWVELFQDDQILAEVEIESKETGSEECVENPFSEKRNAFGDGGSLAIPFLQPRVQPLTGSLVKHGNSFQAPNMGSETRLFLLHHQLRLPC